MCVSATASFTVASLLAPGGAYSTWKILKVEKAYWPLALYPLAFGLQQALEGLVWLELEKQSSLMYVAASGFLFFALFFWPFWIPFSAYWAEDPTSKRKNTLMIFAIIGFLYGLLEYLPVVFNIHEWVVVKVNNGSIDYQFTIDILSRNLFIGMYSILVIIPLILSTRKSMKTLGICIVTSVILSYFLYGYAFISVWCFIAALVSALTFYFTYQKLQNSQQS
jgi:hypothetical protein